MAAYRDPVIGKLIAVLNSEGPAMLKGRYFYGDPLTLPPRSALPACFISRDNTTIGNATNAEDESNMVMILTVAMDSTVNFTNFDSIGAANNLYDVLEGRNADYTLKSTSITYVLRKHKVLDTKLWINLRNPLTVDYGINQRPPGTYSIEGNIKFQVTHHQLRPL